MRTCLFCDHTTLNREHVWPEWISKFLLGEPRKGRLQAIQITTDQAPVHSYFAPELNHKARVVCYDCNHGWMSDVETATCDILKPMMLGRSMMLGSTSRSQYARGLFSER